MTTCSGRDVVAVPGAWPAKAAGLHTIAVRHMGATADFKCVFMENSEIRMDEWLRKRCGLPQSLSFRGETASSAGQSRISEQGGARPRQMWETAEVKQSDSATNVRGVELEIASATEIDVLCRTAAAWAIS